MLLTIHKINNPGRPIVSACACPTEQISAYPDSIFQPLVTNLETYIIDTNYALSIFADVVLPTNKPFSLFLLDAISLYTSLPHADGLKVVKYFLNTHISLPSALTDSCSTN